MNIWQITKLLLYFSVLQFALLVSFLTLQYHWFY